MDEEISFEWDDAKEKINIEKHKVSFSHAARVFLDPNLVIAPDSCEKEERWDAIGMADQVLFVVYTERKGNKIRIISARKANKVEINGYRNQDFRRN